MKISLQEFYHQFKVMVNTSIYDLLDLSNWSKGEALFIKVKDKLPNVVSGPLVNFYPIVNTDAQLNDQKSASFSTVFNQWERISLNGTNKMQDATEANAWSYDSTNDAIS